MLSTFIEKLRQFIHDHRSKGNSQLTDTKLIGVLDLSKNQQDEYRKHRRRKFLLWSLPGIIIVILIALWFILPAPLTHQAIENYNRKDYKSARNWITPLTWTSPEPFVAAFNSGTIDTQLKDYRKAQAELEQALKLAPPNKRCMVLQNLVYSLDAHGVSLKKKEDKDYYMGQATKIKDNNPKCFLKVISEDQPPDPKQPGGGGGGGSQSDTLNASQEQKLLEKNQQGQASQQPNINQLVIDLTSPSTKPW